MSKEYAKKFYKSKSWADVRALVWQRDKGLCQRCLSKGIIKEANTIHHIVPITLENISDPEITLNPDNLTTLCHDCHAAVHKGYEPRYTVDELGRVTVKE